MNTTTKIAAIVPAFNEEKNIKSVVQSIYNLNTSYFRIDVVVINDCSVDSTGQVIDGLNCISLHLPINLGIGGAVQTGYKYAYENRYDYVVQVDGDGQHPVHEIEKLFLTIQESNSDIVIGSRFILKEGFQSTVLRRIGIRYFMWLNKMLLGIKVTDCTSGFRMLNYRALVSVCEYYPDKYPEPESIVCFSLNGFVIKEVPVQMKERQGGVSSIGIITSVYYMIKVTLGIFYTFIRITFRNKK